MVLPPLIPRYIQVEMVELLHKGLSLHKISQHINLVHDLTTTPNMVQYCLIYNNMYPLTSKKDMRDVLSTADEILQTIDIFNYLNKLDDKKLVILVAYEMNANPRDLVRYFFRGGLSSGSLKHDRILIRHKIAEWGWPIYSRSHPRDPSIEARRAVLSEKLKITFDEIDRILRSTE